MLRPKEIKGNGKNRKSIGSRDVGIKLKLSKVKLEPISERRYSVQSYHTGFG